VVKDLISQLQPQPIERILGYVHEYGCGYGWGAQ
jgi:hypothetical protein